MFRKRFIVLLITICLGWAGIASVSAQRCTDPFTGGAVPCPKNKDDKPSNQPEATSTPSDDRDGDGLSNENDRCPDQGGHERNQGCPEDESQDGTNNPTAEPPVNLPFLPLDGRCLLATKGRERVNVRDIPSLNGQIVAQLDPQSTYPVHFHLLGTPPNNDDWFLLSLGWVSETVVRLGGDCDNLPTTDMKLPAVLFDGSADLQELSPDEIDPASAKPLPPFYLQFCGDGSVKLLTDTSPKACDGSVMPFDGLQSVVECDGSVRPINEALEACPEQASKFGILLNDTGEIVAIGFQLDIHFGDFDPQPDPPSPAKSCLMSMGLPSNGLAEKGFNPQPEPPGEEESSNQPSTGLEEKGFNPQPEPPANPHCLLFMNDGNFGGDGGIALLGGMGEEKGIIAINNYGGPNADEQGIIIINGIGNPVVMGRLYNSTDTPPDTKWTGLGNSFIIGESEGQVFACPGSDVSFNPQPEPPADGASSTQPTTGLEEVGFNPQPEPPADGASSTQPTTGLEEVGFNPQPEPPADGASSTQPTTGLEEVGFNPQPEPPPECFNLSMGY